MCSKCDPAGDWVACVDGTVYGPCEDEKCSGVCESQGVCDCLVCHPMTQPITRVTAHNLESGSGKRVDLLPGQYAISCAEPLYVAREQVYDTGTVVITLKRRAQDGDEDVRDECGRCTPATSEPAPSITGRWQDSYTVAPNVVDINPTWPGDAQ